MIARFEAWFARRSIRLKLTLAFAGVSAVLLGGLALALYFSFEVGLDDGINRSLDARAAELGALVPSGGAGRPIDIPGAVGELIDKIAILEIKGRRIDDPDKLANVRHELALLTAKLGMAGLDRVALAPLEVELAAVNEKLWDVEDEIRLCEKAGDFGERFVALARAV